jgi:3-phenylpropionate/cinnamic acid dioxygenase small subunit
MQNDREAFDEIAARKARYCRFVDTKRWNDFSALFTATPQIRFLDVEGKQVDGFNSVSEFVAITARYLEGSRTIHQVHNAEMERVADNRVAATWSMEDYLIFSSDDDTRPESMHGYGHYHEAWELVGGEWRIATLELRRTILEIKAKERMQ